MKKLTLILTLLSSFAGYNVIFLSKPVVYSPVPEILWWKFSDGSGSTVTATVGPNGACGIGSAAPTWIAGLNGGFALQFDGIDDTLSSASSVTYGVNIITVCCWLWWDAFANDDKLLMESSNPFNSNNGTYIIDPNNNGGLAVGSYELAIQDSLTAPGFYREQYFTRPSAAAWHHYCFVFDNSTTTGNIKVYVDAALTSTSIGISSKTGSNNFSAQILYLMSRGNSSLFGAGRLDDLRIYNRELSAGEVTAVKNNPQ